MCSHPQKILSKVSPAAVVSALRECNFHIVAVGCEVSHREEYFAGRWSLGFNFGVRTIWNYFLFFFALSFVYLLTMFITEQYDHRKISPMDNFHFSDEGCLPVPNSKLSFLSWILWTDGNIFL